MCSLHLSILKLLAFMDLLISQIPNAILVVFRWAAFLDPLEIYYPSYPHDYPHIHIPLPLLAGFPTPLEFPVTLHRGVWIFSGTTQCTNCAEQVRSKYTLYLFQSIIIINTRGHESAFGQLWSKASVFCKMTTI